MSTLTLGRQLSESEIMALRSHPTADATDVWNLVATAEGLRSQRDQLLSALDFMYRYFVMPGHAQQAKDCPNKDCPFCKAEVAMAAAAESSVEVKT